MEFEIRSQYKGQLELFVVSIQIKRDNSWVFLRAFASYSRAKRFIDEVIAEGEKGNYEWLSLKN